MGEYNKSSEYGINQNCEYLKLPDEINSPENEYSDFGKEFNISEENEYNSLETTEKENIHSIEKKIHNSYRNIMKLGATAVAVFVLSTLMVNSGGDTLFGFSYTDGNINNGNTIKNVINDRYNLDDSDGKGKESSDIPDADNANYTMKLVKVTDETYSSVVAVSDNLLIACKNSKWGLIDGSGKVVKDFTYDAAMVLKYDFIGYVLVSNNSNGSTQQIYDSDNNLVYTRECEVNENIVGYTEDYVHIRKVRSEEEIKRTKGNYDVTTEVGEFTVRGDGSLIDKDTYVYLKNGQVINEFSIDGMDYYRQEFKKMTEEGWTQNSIYYWKKGGTSRTYYGFVRAYAGSSSVINGYIIPAMMGDFYYKVENGNLIIEPIEITSNEEGLVRCRCYVSGNLIYIDLYSPAKGRFTWPYAELKKSYLYNVETKQEQEIATFDSISSFMNYECGNPNEKYTLFSRNGYIFGIIKEKGQPAGDNSYYLIKKLYAISKNDISNKISIDVDDIISSYTKNDKEILFVKKGNKYGYITDDNYNKVRLYTYDASDFSEDGYAIVSDSRRYSDIIDTNFNVVGRTDFGVYSIAYCNYFIKKEFGNEHSLYRLEKIR